MVPFLLVLALPAFEAAAQGYPARPVRMIVPYPPGGGSDITGRAVGTRLNVQKQVKVRLD